MIISILFAFILAKIKGYKLLLAFKTFSLYPLFLVEATYIFFQVNTFMGNYYFLQYAGYIKSAYMYVLILPILLYKLYVPAIAGSGLVFLGTILNKIVIFFNDGKMPIYPTLSKLTGYYKVGAIEKGSDALHILVNENTKLVYLTDYIDVGFSILSIGDVLIHSFIFVIVYFTIKAISIKKAFMDKKN